MQRPGWSAVRPRRGNAGLRRLDTHRRARDHRARNVGTLSRFRCHRIVPSNASSSTAHGTPAAGGIVPRRLWASLILALVSAVARFPRLARRIASIMCRGRGLPRRPCAILAARSGDFCAGLKFCAASSLWHGSCVQRECRADAPSVLRPTSPPHGPLSATSRLRGFAECLIAC